MPGDIEGSEDGGAHEMWALETKNVAAVKMEEWTSAIARFANQDSQSLQSERVVSLWFSRTIRLAYIQGCRSQWRRKSADGAPDFRSDTRICDHDVEIGDIRVLPLLDKIKE